VSFGLVFLIILFWWLWVVALVVYSVRRATNRREERNGPMPDEVALRSRKVRRWVYVLYAAFLVAGYAVAASIAQGPTFKRLDLGFIGIFVAMVLAQVILVAAGVGSAARLLTKRRSNSHSASGERQTPDP